MAKDTNTSRCPVTVSECNNLGHTVTSDSVKFNDGFSIRFDVVCLGYDYPIKELRSVSRFLYDRLRHCLSDYESDLTNSRVQPEFSFGDPELEF